MDLPLAQIKWHPTNGHCLAISSANNVQIIELSGFSEVAAPPKEDNDMPPKQIELTGKEEEKKKESVR